MGLFSFFSSKHKKLRSTHEAETCRTIFRENEELFLRVEKSEELRRLRQLDAEINSPRFKQQRKEIEQLTYKGSECHTAEKQYKALLKTRKLQSYLIVNESKELEGYRLLQNTEEFREYVQLKAVVKSPDFDRQLHAAEALAYKKLIAHPKIKAAIKVESLRRFKEYSEIAATDLPVRFQQLNEFIHSDEFNAKRKYLLDKKRYRTTEGYALEQEYEALKKLPDIVRYQALLHDAYFNNRLQWMLAFSDEFDRNLLGGSRWITRYNAGERFLSDTYGVGKDVQLYMPSNITFSGSMLFLNFRREEIIGKYWDANLGITERKYDYTSGLISSAQAFRQQYGRFEAKIKYRRSPLTASFWLAGDKATPHVNIMKVTADGLHLGHIHTEGAEVKDSDVLLKDLLQDNTDYIFTLEWTPEKLVWMINDTVVKEERENIPHMPMYLAFSLGALTPPADKTLPARMEIDWVRVYTQRNPQ